VPSGRPARTVTRDLYAPNLRRGPRRHNTRKCCVEVAGRNWHPSWHPAQPNWPGAEGINRYVDAPEPHTNPGQSGRERTASYAQFRVDAALEPGKHPIGVHAQRDVGRGRIAPAVFVRRSDRIAPTATRYPVPSQLPHKERSGEGKLSHFFVADPNQFFSMPRKVFEPYVYSYECPQNPVDNLC
jgi:hypothetical protein